MQTPLLQPCKQLKTSQSNQNNLYLKEKSWRHPALLKYAKFPNEVPLLVEVEVSLIKILKTSGNPCQGKFHWFYSCLISSLL